jgi:hypothetical protein
VQEVVAQIGCTGDGVEQERKAQNFPLLENRGRLAGAAQGTAGCGVDFEDSDIWDMQVHRVLSKMGFDWHGA